MYLKTIKKLSIEAKLAMLIFFSHIETNLSSTYNHLAEQFKHNSEEQEVCVITHDFDSINRRGTQRNQLNLPPIHGFFKYYRIITSVYLSLNLVKYSILLLSIDAKVLPLELNCYLPGRVSITAYLLDLSRLIGLYMLVIVLIWRIINATTRQGYELDLILFLLHDHEFVKVESLEISDMNRKTTYSNTQSEAICLQNLIQRVLFYEVRHGKVLLYRKRPNRSEWARKEMIKLLDRLFYLPLLIILFAAITIPGIVHASLTDMNFNKLYPSCCPQLEALNPNDWWQLSLNHCWIRLVTIPIDFMDNVLLIVEFSLTIGPPTVIGILVTRDLLLQWDSIKLRINHLARRLRWQQRPYLQFDNSTYPNHIVGDKSKFNDHLYMKGFGEFGVNHETDTNELVSLLCDFFESLGRANQFVGFYLSFLVAAFFGATLILGYAAYLIPDHWKSIALCLLSLTLYLAFLSASAAVLTLKGFLDESYGDICTLMALDKLASRKRKWMLILDNYTQRARNTYILVMGTRFTWAFVLNCMATSISFLAAVETYKAYWKERH